MTPTQACMSDRDREQLAHDQLAPEELNRIEDHLSECSFCQEMLEAGSPDTSWCSEIRQVLTRSADPLSLPDESMDDRSILQMLGPSDDPHMLGRIGSYEVIGVIGRGGMGVVFKADDVALDRSVAIKMLLPHLAASGGARRRFSREAQAAAAVIDDHVLPIYRVDQWQGIPYLVTQYSPGTTLQKRIQDQGPLELKEILRIALQTARGLAAAHAQGLVHRDVKPSNILLDRTVERALLTDFGLARAADDASITQSGTVSGTPQYMSPEQVRGECVDARSDLFSLGCTMYTMCTGRAPFRSDSPYAVMHRITNEKATPIREIGADIPDWLCVIIERLMSKRPDDRFESASEVAELLEDCLAHVQQPAAVALPGSLKKEGRLTQSSRFSGGFWQGTWTDLRRLIVGAVVAVAMLCAGTLIVLELNKGTLTIESQADDVRVRIRKGNRIVETLAVTKAGTSIRIAAGEYIVEIDGDIDEFTVSNEKVTLRRGEDKVVEIVRKPEPASEKPTKKIAENTKALSPLSDLKRLQQVWTMGICDSEAEGFGGTQKVVRNWRWAIQGNRVFWSRSGSELWQMQLSVDPETSPKEIDLTYLDGPHKGRKSLGIYRWGGTDGKTLELSLQDPGASVARPKSIGTRGGNQTSLIVLKPRDSSRESLQGVWTMQLCDSATEGFGDKMKVVRYWRWIIQDNEIQWLRSRGKVWRMAFSVDPKKSPNEIDLTYLDGPFKGRKSLGMYRWGGIRGNTLELSIQDPGADAPRPKKIGMRSYESSLIFLNRLDVGKELASLQGTWKFDVFYTDSLPKPARGEAQRCVIKGNEIAWTSTDGERIRVSFTIDPTKVPCEIDMTFLSGPHKGRKCLAIYQHGIGGAVLSFCVADPGGKVSRPKDISYGTLEGKTMIVLVPPGDK